MTGADEIGKQLAAEKGEEDKEETVVAADVPSHGLGTLGDFMQV